MTKGYWIARVDVDDPKAYEKYVEANAKPLAQYGGKFLVRGGKHEAPEGNPRARNVVLEFSSYQQALDCYNCSEYQHAKALRDSVSEGDVVIIEGYDGPQPSN